MSQSRFRVAAGILIDIDGRVLITDRSRAKSMQEYWEFPGGKTLGGETGEETLQRELGEELGIEVLSCELLHSLTHDYPEMCVEIDFFLVKKWRGKPTGMEGQVLKWSRPQDMSADILLPADAPVLDLLKNSNRD